MNYKPILIVHGEPNSIFLEIFFKSIKFKKFKSPLILICSYKLLKYQMKILGFKNKINLIKLSDLRKKINNSSINVIDIDYKLQLKFKRISKESKDYIKKSFNTAFKIINLGITNKLINGPISKKAFLNKNYLGMTEYISDKFKVKKNAMLIYNKRISVCPITTHLPLKLVAKKIKPNLIVDKVILINNFYKTYLNKKPRIAVLGLNPHCESIERINEDEKIILPTVKLLKKLNYKIFGPFSADTMFLKKNRSHFDVILGMYHDQVLTPIKTLLEYDAVNITLGLPFLRISPDHGPNEKMLGKNISNPLSLIRSIQFLDKN
tara:strand:- start:844 stop:1806 length:963 start_codon:yes stop_codon:yes gene_type:complete